MTSGTSCEFKSICFLISAEPLVFLLDFYLFFHVGFSSLIQPTGAYWWKLLAEKANEVSGKPQQKQKQSITCPGASSDL